MVFPPRVSPDGCHRLVHLLIVNKYSRSVKAGRQGHPAEVARPGSRDAIGDGIAKVVIGDLAVVAGECLAIGKGQVKAQRAPDVPLQSRRHPEQVEARGEVRSGVKQFSGSPLMVEANVTLTSGGRARKGKYSRVESFSERAGAMNARGRMSNSNAFSQR